LVRAAPGFSPHLGPFPYKPKVDALNQIPTLPVMKYPLHRPNAETRRAIRDAMRRRGITRFKDKASLYKSLGL